MRNHSSGSMWISGTPLRLPSSSGSSCLVKYSMTNKSRAFGGRSRKERSQMTLDVTLTYQGISLWCTSKLTISNSGNYNWSKNNRKSRLGSWRQLRKNYLRGSYYSPKCLPKRSVSSQRQESSQSMCLSYLRTWQLKLLLHSKNKRVPRRSLAWLSLILVKPLTKSKRTQVLPLQCRPPPWLTLSLPSVTSNKFKCRKCHHRGGCPRERV